MTALCVPCATKFADQSIESINGTCFCITLKAGALKRALAQDLGSPDVFHLLDERCPYLFSARPIFLSESQIQVLGELIAAIESVIAMPAFRARILDRAPLVVRHDPRGATGVFFGYDFHVHNDGIGVIEINTNAGGAMLNAILARAQQACCTALDDLGASAGSARQFEEQMVAMFRSEWSKSGHTSPLSNVAIVDVAPEQQFLYPEFLLFQQLFERHGINAVICDPARLRWAEGGLWHGETKIDLVYNRLTDFLLDEPASAALRAAYLADAVVVTPHPQAHALYADKRNLALLSNPGVLQELGVPADVQKVLLDHIPATQVVSAELADQLWENRRQLFFKPTSGYGGRAAYRGDKLTKRVWLEILAGDYIAQRIVPPGRRAGGSSLEPEELKFDIRCYTYAGRTQWTAARVYQGQTTNFRTPGGGFAPVYSIPDAELLDA